VDVEREHPRTRYRDVLAETLRRAAADLGLALRADDAWILAATLPSWPVFDDVVPALDALRARGWRLALLTNCDRDLIAATQRRLDVVLDAVVTAEAVGSYKPAPGHFLRFADSFRPDTWVHVAEGYTFDIEPAHQLGLPAVWVNRQGERRDASIAGAVLDGLGGLVEAVESVAGR
jgi:2-haloacid dehalogenase